MDAAAVRLADSLKIMLAQQILLVEEIALVRERLAELGEADEARDPTE